jgi:hypothetical protein
MFRDLQRLLQVNPLDPLPSANTALTGFRPSELSEYLEAVWTPPWQAEMQRSLNGEEGNAGVTALVLQLMGRGQVIDPPVGVPVIQNPPDGRRWPHLVYAALLEQTRIVSIAERVLFECAHGERLSRVTPATLRWLHATEQLFFAAPWPYSVRAVTSSIRPDPGAVRRNAYWRMFGWDVPGGPDGRPYPFVKAEAANREFTVLFEALLAEVWRAFTYRGAALVQDETDINAMATLLRRLREMLQSRRLYGTLAREEFDAVALLSWLHLTVEFNTDVVVSLDCQAGGISDRLRRLGERVGVAAHAQSDAFFRLADPVSDLLRAIEASTPTAPIAVTDLYTNGGQFTARMLEIITHWSVATGRNLKDPSVRRPIGTVLSAAAPQMPIVVSSSQPVARPAALLR